MAPGEIEYTVSGDEMSYWFYQINPQQWEPERFRIEIWENEPWSWTVGKAKLGGEEPESGDSVAFFYTRQGDDPGFFGWAVVLGWHKGHDGSRTLYFRPVTPTNHLKMHPWWDDEAKDLADKVRGKMPRATLWRVPDELWKQIRTGVTTWVGGRRSEMSSE